MSSAPASIDTGFGAALERRAQVLAGGTLSESRADAVRRFRERGFPTQRLEDWKYTDLASVADLSERWVTAAAAAPAPDLDRIREIQDAVDADWIVIANGKLVDYCSTVSAAAGVAIKRFDDSEPCFDDALSDLNTALFVDGVAVAVQGDTAKPIGILVIDSASGGVQVAQTRVEIRVADNTSAQLIEYHVSAGDAEHYQNTLIDLALARGAQVEYARLQVRDASHSHTARLNVRLAADSTFVHSGIDLGGRLARNDLAIDVAEPGASATFDGLYIVSGGQHVDNHTRVDHRVGPAVSSQEYRGILDGESRAVWNGKAIAHAGADGTDAEQANHNLLLSEKCEVDAKPELEIYADEVKCSHGTTVGQLDAAALFYLRSRGLDRKTAERALIRAFATSVADSVPVAALHDHALARVEAKLSAITDRNPS